ncbi:methylated-DNA--[protein]-cysteine S-methyltransferase [Cytophagales bacterium LB-30]|uniref:Methylated-DNA--protein-cysteine methyltransferase n=1 Tax=Shiella aurantiaca TaxID=3058365 RepID=A0ABT8F817_9BACT|nr:methylated-DNA--[protein]-cysteine S-methyltransferase [Shiella aurantiaca]MDN4166428.1 methylated-DNA--[protein]-cysteine S-methyltransferase [Shiella aurantiaca]
MTHTDYYSSPIGLLEIRAKEDQLLALSFLEEEQKSSVNPSDFTQEVKKQLEEYFSGVRSEFTLALAPQGTEFQEKVWQMLQTIPVGQTTSYLTMARQLGDEKVIRAAASANGKNPIAILIPCHRVIGSDGSLTGYAGGLWRKKWLLEHEQKMLGKPVQASLFE